LRRSPLFRALTAGALVLSSAGLAQEQGELELFQLDAELNARTQVASSKAESIRTSPGVITIVNRSEISDAGARDLLDVLMLVPGFYFGVVVEGVVGVGFRGNWGHEGKVLLLLDGQEMNEALYSTLQFGNHFPVDQIERVEIIRGPGSAQYGGDAELAVINVVTRGAKELHGVAVSGSYAQERNGFGRRTVSLQWGQEFSKVPGLSASVSAFVGEGQRSTGQYIDVYGDRFSMNDASRTDPAQVNAALTYKDFSLRFLYDNYKVGSRDGYDQALDRTDGVAFQSLFAEASYTWKVSDKLTITPRVNLRRQEPWNTPDVTSALYYDKRVDRVRGRLNASYAFTGDLNLTAGVDAYNDHAILSGDGSTAGFNAPFQNGATSVAYQTVAGFAELAWDNPIVNVVAGARVEHNSQFGDSFVPRLALTKVVGRFHAKALASRAYRAPGVENFSLNPDIKAEHTTVFEVETGYELNDVAFVSANAFDMTISDPIVYNYDPVTSAESYLNADRTGTRGLEATLKLKGSFGFLNVGYSFYSASAKNEVDYYSVPGSRAELLGMPQHKATLSGSARLWRNLTLNPSAVFVSDRHGYSSVDGSGNAQLSQFDPVLLLNLFVEYKDLYTPGLDLGVGVYNALGSSFAFIQPYNNLHAPLPAMGREFLVRLRYQLPIP
jgi:outer membrane receptor for ferrienterochelin and colicin